MDFSQLPKMSDTPKPPAPPKPDAPNEPRRAAVPLDYTQAPSSVGFGFASVWISLIVGVILLMLGGNFGRWATARLTGHPFPTGVNWTTGDLAGQPVEYFELQGGTAWSEAGLFLMGVALLLDAVLLFSYLRGRFPSPNWLRAAILFVGAAMALNILVAFKLFGMGILPLMTVMALLPGGMMLFDHLATLREQTERAKHKATSLESE